MTMPKDRPEVTIRTSEPGDAGYVAYMHGIYYCKKYGLYSTFEYYFIKYLAEFVQNPAGGQLWMAGVGGQIVGSAAIVRASDQTAQFRWFLVDEDHQGMGIGKKLIETALDFCRENHYEDVFLWTYKGLDRARALYDRAGFVVTEEKVNTEWSNTPLTEQKMELTLR